MSVLRYLKVEYYATNTVRGIEDLFQKGFSEAEFIEGFMFAQDNAVIMLANFTNEEPRLQQVRLPNLYAF